jgi:hypothetical protein
MSSLLVFNRVYKLETPLVILRPSNLLTGSSTPSLPCVNKYSGVHVFIQEGGGDRGPQTDKHLPPSAFTGQFLRKADI